MRRACLLVLVLAGCAAETAPAGWEPNSEFRRLARSIEGRAASAWMFFQDYGPLRVTDPKEVEGLRSSLAQSMHRAEPSGSVWGTKTDMTEVEFFDAEGRKIASFQLPPRGI